MITRIIKKCFQLATMNCTCSTEISNLPPPMISPETVVNIIIVGFIVINACVVWMLWSFHKEKNNDLVVFEWWIVFVCWMVFDVLINIVIIGFITSIFSFIMDVLSVIPNLFFSIFTFLLKHSPVILGTFSTLGGILVIAKYYDRMWMWYRKRYGKIFREEECAICHEKPATELFIACGHLILCKECYDTQSRCPMCRAQKICDV